MTATVVVDCFVFARVASVLWDVSKEALGKDTE